MNKTLRNHIDLLNYLTEKIECLEQEEDKVKVRSGIVSIFEKMGYGTIANEIRLDKRAVDNALYGLNLYYNKVDYPNKKHTNQLNKFINKMGKLISNTL